jgi:SAM-dependent methyltransferase
MITERDRKQLEREFHDRWRAGAESANTPLLNNRFYSIGRAGHDFTVGWLQEHCGGKRVLDYCCGDGKSTIRLLSHSPQHATGIDISPESVALGKQQAALLGETGRVSFVVGDAEALPYPDRSFDVAVVSGVLHHLDLDKAYSELARVLTDDGVVICTEALKHNPVFHLYRKLTPTLRTAWEVDHILGRRQIHQARVHFADVRVERFFYLVSLLAVPFRNTKIFGPLLTGLEKVDAVLMSIPGFQWWGWVAVFTLRKPRR